MSQGKTLLFPIIIASVVSLFASSLSAQDSLRCSVPELTDNAEYNRLVCRGVARQDAGDYAGAVSAFDQALGIRFIDVPNFKLFPRLALTAALAGDTTRAHAALERARLSLSVLTGIYRCSETDEGYELVDADGESLAGAAAGDVVGRMCGAAYDYYYRRTSLRALAHDCELVTYYLSVLQELRVP